MFSFLLLCIWIFVIVFNRAQLLRIECEFNTCANTYIDIGVCVVVLFVVVVALVVVVIVAKLLQEN